MRIHKMRIDQRHPANSRVALFVILLSSGGTATAQDGEPEETPKTVREWRGFRGSDGTASSPGVVPRQFGAKQNLGWKIDLPGPGTSSPIVVGGQVFLTCWSGYGLDRKKPGDPKELKRHLLAIDSETGKIAWRRTIDPVPTEDPFGGRMATHGYASSTPVSDGKNVYVFFGKAGVFAYSLEGEKLWQADVGKGSSKWLTGSGSSPALSGNLLFVNASDESHTLRALDKRTGKEVWKRGGEELDQAYCTPILAGTGDDAVLLYALLGEVWGLAPATGEPRFTVKTRTNGALAPSIVLGDDNVFFSFGGQTGKRSYAIKLGGSGDVTKTHVAWATRYGSYVTTPLAFEGHLYWVNESGIVYCAEQKTGELVFQERFDGVFYSSPVRVGDAIYFVSRDSGVFVIAAKPEFQLLHQNLIEGDESNFDATPAVSANRLFLRSGTHLYNIH